MLSISETGKIYIYVSFEDTYIEIIYEAGAPLPIDESKRRLIGALYIDEYKGYRRLNPNPGSSIYREGMLQLWAGDIHPGGDSLPTPSNEYEVLTAISNAGSLTWESGWVRFHA
jgi:hypothetical protein